MPLAYICSRRNQFSTRRLKRRWRMLQAYMKGSDKPYPRYIVQVKTTALIERFRNLHSRVVELTWQDTGSLRFTVQAGRARRITSG
eukprot:698730-Pyramimonas_sp.AAC.2